MSCFCLSDGFHRAPQVENTSMAARGLWGTLASWTAGEAYERGANGPDIVFDRRRVRMLGGTARQLAELETAGLVEPAGDGRWRIAESRRTGGYGMDVFKDPAKVRAGRKGGLASHGQRPERGWLDASSENDENREAEPKQGNGSASTLLQADAEQGESDAPSTPPSSVQADDEQKPSDASSGGQAPAKPQVAGTIPTPTPPAAHGQAPGQAAGQAAGVRVDLDAAATALDRRIDREPERLIAETYRPTGGDPDRNRRAVRQTIDAGLDPKRLYAAVLAHTRAIDNGDLRSGSEPRLARWLETGAYRPWLPEPASVPERRHEHTWNCRHVRAIMHPKESSYSHQRQGWAPSPWMSACQECADRLNREEVTA